MIPPAIRSLPRWLWTRLRLFFHKHDWEYTTDWLRTGCPAKWTEVWTVFGKYRKPGSAVGEILVRWKVCRICPCHKETYDTERDWSVTWD